MEKSIIEKRQNSFFLKIETHFDKMSLSEKLSQRDVCLRPVLGNVIRNKYIYWVSQKVIEVFP